ncbi:MAG: alpha/beta hydrolase [Desulfovibrionaceae bacterium]
MGHISEQARRFIKANRAMELDGPLTPASAQKLRGAITAATQESLNALHKSLQCSTERRKIGDVDVVIVRPKNGPLSGSGKIALYVHGGGYALKSALDAGALLMADRLGIPVYSVEYRLAPEHPFPAGLEDCLAVYRELIKEFDHRSMVVFGGSAGGGLALTMLLQARTEGAPMPRAVGLFSPWADLTRTGDSYYANEGRDPVLKWEGNLEYFAASYAGERDPKDPLLSPVYGDYGRGFPPTLIVTGTRDLFLSNSVRLARVLRTAGAEAKLRVWEEMFHGFDLSPDLPEGEEARSEMADFLLQALQD